MENREFYLQDDGIDIHCKLDLPAENPAGNPADRLPLMILIHGFTGHMEEEHILAVMRAANEAGCAVLRAEMHGHGKSGGAFRDHTLFKWISNAMTVIDYARNLEFVTDLYLAGHSQGGLLTILVAAMESDRLQAILPLSPALCIPADARRGEVLGGHFDPVNIPEEIVVDDGTALSGNHIRVSQMIDTEAAIRRFRGPVLIVHGSADETVPVQYSIDAARLYTNAKLVVIPGDTHCYDLHVDMLADAVRTFLQDLPEHKNRCASSSSI
ncbi:MAG: alpha/beta fold hydrolase [Eubacteriales bacterium]|nr:alpha/beta fold hydrolase [Eubacteriales bacterium]